MASIDHSIKYEEGSLTSPLENNISPKFPKILSLMFKSDINT